MSARFKKDNKGVSGLAVLLVVILIFGGWYVASLYYDIPFLNDIIDESLNEDTPTDIFMNFKLYNPSDNSEWLQDYLLDTWDTGADIDVSAVPDELDVLDLNDDPLYDADGVQITLKTNAPSIILGDKWRVYGILEQHKIAGNEFFEIINENLDYEPRGEKTITITIPHANLISYALTQWNEIDLYLYNPSGIVQEHIEFAIVR